jgi:predicted acetyltransferase
MNTARIHSSGVIQSRHYTRKNMNTVGGGGGCYVFVLPSFRGKGFGMEVGVLVFCLGFHEKIIKI